MYMYRVYYEHLFSEDSFLPTLTTPTFIIQKCRNILIKYDKHVNLLRRFRFVQVMHPL